MSGRAGGAMAERRRQARVQGAWAGGAAGRLAGKAGRRLGPAGRAGGGGRAGCRAPEPLFGRAPFFRCPTEGSARRSAALSVRWSAVSRDLFCPLPQHRRRPRPAAVPAQVAGRRGGGEIGSALRISLSLKSRQR